MQASYVDDKKVFHQWEMAIHFLQVTLHCLQAKVSSFEVAYISYQPLSHPAPKCPAVTCLVSCHSLTYTPLFFSPQNNAGFFLAVYTVIINLEIMTFMQSKFAVSVV